MFALLRDKNFLKILIIILAICLSYPLVSLRIKTLHNARLKTQDLIFNIQHKLKKSLPDKLEDIVIISIESSSFEVLNRRWPWTRDVFVVLIEKLKKLSPRLICIDLAFMGASADAAVDELLAKSMKDAGNVIIASHFSKEGEYILPDKTIRESAAGFGFINKPRDIDYAVRRVRPVILSVKGNVIDYSFSLKIAAAYLGVPFENISYDYRQKIIALKPEGKGEDYIIELGENKDININYFAAPDSFKTIPFWQVVTEKVDPDTLKDKIVFVGMTSEIFHDIYQTPLGLMPGVLVNANETLMYITGDFIKKVSDSISFLIQLFVALTILIITYRFGLTKGFFTMIALLFIAFSTAFLLLFQNRIWNFFGIFIIAVGTYVISYGYKSIGFLVDNMILRKEATTDGLTGLYVYRYFELKLGNEFKKAKEIRRELALIILDIDHFKKINDTYGHENGNIILKELAKIMNKFSRRTDTVCRYGGEEFCVILINTDREGALRYAENMRKTIEDHNFEISKGILRITVSMGIDIIQDDVRSAGELIKRADTALYRAKETGRNRVILFR